MSERGGMCSSPLGDGDGEAVRSLVGETECHKVVPSRT